jgi:hypothetical protein
VHKRTRVIKLEEADVLSECGVAVYFDWNLRASTLRKIQLTPLFKQKYPAWKHYTAQFFVEVDDAEV